MLLNNIVHGLKRLRGEYSLWERLFRENKKTQKSLDTVTKYVSYQKDTYQSRTRTSERQWLLYNLASRSLLNNELSESYRINQSHFILFHYFYHNPLFNGCFNVGDYIQTIATKGILTNIEPNRQYLYWDRDCLNFFNPPSSEKYICVMQGWFSHTFNFLPNSSILPVWVGTHFDEATQRYLKEVACIGPSFLQQEIGL